MARSRETKIELTAYDDLFQTDESREEAKLSKIRDIPISEIDEFPDHPFKVLMDEDSFGGRYERQAPFPQTWRCIAPPMSAASIPAFRECPSR